MEYKYINNNLKEALINSVAYINIGQPTLKRTKLKPMNYIKSNRVYEQCSVSLARRKAKETHNHVATEGLKKESDTK